MPSAPSLAKQKLRLLHQVHGDQKFEIFSPVKAGDGLTCAATIESYRVAAGNEIVTVRSDLQCAGELVISAWSTLVVRA